MLGVEDMAGNSKKFWYKTRLNDMYETAKKQRFALLAAWYDLPERIRETPAADRARFVETLQDLEAHTQRIEAVLFKKPEHLPAWLV